jgi:hypothetical protein
MTAELAALQERDAAFDPENPGDYAREPWLQELLLERRLLLDLLTAAYEALTRALGEIEEQTGYLSDDERKLLADLAPLGERK